MNVSYLRFITLDAKNRNCRFLAFHVVNTDTNLYWPNQKSLLQLPMAFNISGKCDFFVLGVQGGAAQDPMQMTVGFKHDQLEKIKLPSHFRYSPVQVFSIIDRKFRLNALCYLH